MKIPKKELKKQFSTRLKPSVIKKLQDQSTKDDIPISNVIEYLVEECLK